MDFLQYHVFEKISYSPFTALACLVLLSVVLVHALPWALDPHGIRDYPGPWLAKFSDLWLGVVTLKGRRSEVVQDVHRTYGRYFLSH